MILGFSDRSRSGKICRVGYKSMFSCEGGYNVDTVCMFATLCYD